MRLPTRLHITWADADTLKLETDAGQQTRLFHFIASSPQVGEVTWQGDSAAMWVKQAQQKGFGRPHDGPAPRKGGALKVVTTHMRPGYLRKNGVPQRERRTNRVLRSCGARRRFLIDPHNVGRGRAISQ